MKTILVYPNEILREVTPKIWELNQEIEDQIDEVKKNLSVSEDTAAGLAATQLGFKTRFFGLKNRDGKTEIFINPKLKKTFGAKTYPMIIFNDGKKEEFLEGCLSFPNLFGTVKRFLKIEAEWDEVKNEKLETRNKILEGFEAIVFQHEAEHLDGILFVDHIKKEGGKLYRFEGEEKRKLISVDEVLNQ